MQGLLFPTPMGKGVECLMEHAMFDKNLQTDIEDFPYDKPDKIHFIRLASLSSTPLPTMASETSFSKCNSYGLPV